MYPSKARILSVITPLGDTAATDIQTAVNIAANGDNIYIGTGVYTGSVTSLDYPDGQTNIVYLEATKESNSRYLNFIGATGNPDDVILDGQGKYRPICLRAYTDEQIEPVRLMNLTVKNGAAELGGGVYALMGRKHPFEDGDSPLLEIINCNIVSNITEASAGGLACSATGTT